MKNPKTTILGILTIAGGVIAAAVAFLNGHLDSTTLTTLGVAFTAGLGLIHGKDDTVSGTNSQKIN